MKRLFTLFFVLLTIIMGARAEESFSTWLENYGSQKMEVIKLLKNELGITLSEAQNLVNAAPCCVAHGRTQAETQDLVAKLNDKGATAELRVDINAANFPDNTFRTYVAENSQSDDDNDHLSNVEIAAVKEISVIEKNITSLKGVEFFTALETLDCNCNYQIKSLDLSKNVNLKYLDCSVTQLTTLDLTNNTKLVKLRCLTIGLPSLDVTKNTALVSLNCSGNKLTSLDVTKNTALTYLNCYHNNLTSVNVTKNTALQNLDCSYNQLTSLNLAQNTTLDTLNCFSNKLTSLDLSKNTKLKILHCYSNQLTSLDLSKNTALILFSCSNNQLTSLDLSKNTSLTYVSCSYNRLKGLDVTNNTALNRISCYTNQIGEAAMFEFVMSLPDGGSGKWLTVYNEGEDEGQIEGNVITKEQVAIAKGKGWNVYLLNEEFSSVSYEGVDPTGLPVTKTNFPDATFRAYVKANCQSDGDDILTDEEIAAVTKIDVHNKGITSLKGVERFTALKELYCYTNKITALDVTKNTQLTRLACNSNKLKTLDLTKNTKLENLNCSSNQLPSLNVTKNTKLWRLVCSSNKLTTLNVSKNTLLTEFKCNENQLTTLTVTNNKKLTTLECCNNQIGEEAMDKLVKSMPTVSGTPGVFVPFNNSKADGNVINTRQVNEAKAKNWNVKALKDGDYVDYEGVIPSGIDEVTVEPATEGRHYTDDRYYTLDGRPLDATPTQRGIYIHHGKKIVVK
ncbi:MAG: ribosomal protein L7/L12 [Prevotella sp.]|nr:ribosomal protein L7/L12 [Prevotella sp.]